jgi:hypothetical protein
MEERESVTVTFGEMKIAPVQYNNFAVGPFFMTTQVKPGETPAQAMDRAYATLEAFARKSYASKLEQFRAALQSANEAIRGRR